MAEGVSPSPTPSASERIADSYKRLAESASTLNKVSDEFALPVQAIETALRRLNLGVEAWEKVRGYDDDNNRSFMSEHIGFTKLASGWGWVIALRKTTGNHDHPDMDDVDTWHFSEGPRSLRIAAVDKLPDLVEKLVAVADKTARKMKEKQADVVALASAVNEAASASDPKKGGKR